MGPRPVFNVDYLVFSGPRIWIVKTAYRIGVFKQKILEYPIFVNDIIPNFDQFKNKRQPFSVQSSLKHRVLAKELQLL